jgi:hypothetical protein
LDAAASSEETVTAKEAAELAAIFAESGELPAQNSIEMSRDQVISRVAGVVSIMSALLR